jgi:hypothetical protein
MKKMKKVNISNNSKEKGKRATEVKKIHDGYNMAKFCEMFPKIDRTVITSTETKSKRENQTKYIR